MTFEEIGELVSSSFGLMFFAALFWGVFLARRRKRVHAVDDGPQDETYRIFTTQFDIETDGASVSNRLIGASPDYAKGWLKLGKDAWAVAVARADEIFERAVREADHVEAKFTSRVSGVGHEDALVTLLIDQSGSMRDEPMAHAAASARLASETLARMGAKTEILGFSTAGWHGGFPALKWREAGKPKRPGRLCALLHVIYKSADDEALSTESWKALLNPNVLRENIDGEAIEWARARMRLRPESHKVLLIISDGAPVDDMTLMHNGPSYLVKHFHQVVEAIRSDASITMGGIGIGCDVNRFYEPSVTVRVAEEIPTAVAEILGVMLASNRAIG